MLGSIQPVEKIVQTDQTDNINVSIVNLLVPASTESQDPSEQSQRWHHLDKEQQAIVREMLYEESNAFAQDDNDIGCIPSLQKTITLEDDIPVQRCYTSIPKPLYQEVKAYIQDLLAKKWIFKSKSPVVCVHKKDGSLRLCIDYRLLKQKTVPDRHPLPRIQDLIDRLGGYSWFSILDQGKDYQQGFICRRVKAYDSIHYSIGPI